MLSALHSQGSGASPGEEDDAEVEEREDGVDLQEEDSQELSCESGDQDVEIYSNTPSCTSLQVPGESGRRRTMSNTAAHKVTHAPAAASDKAGGGSNKVTTVYVTVGKAGKPVSKVESSSEGPVQAMLRRLGSLQRQREHDPGKPKPKGAEGITKPPRRKLGARARVWEQGGPSGGEAGICKPIRRKHAPANTPDVAGAIDTTSLESGPATRPLSTILKSVPEAASGSEPRADEDRQQGNEPRAGQSESTYLTVGPAGGAARLTDVIADEGAAVSGNDEPCYENVMIMHTYTSDSSHHQPV